MAAVARAIRVVHRRTVHRLAVLPHRQLLGDGERLAVTHDHADDVVGGWNPGGDKRVDAHARQADLAARAVGMLERQGRQFLFVRAPAHLGRRRALLAKALDAPGIDELVDLFGPVGDLRVALAAVNDLDAQLMGQVVELLGLGVVRDPLGLCGDEFPIRQGPLRDVQQGVLGEMADQSRVGAMLEDRGRSGFRPGRHHLSQLHVAPVERPLGGRLVAGAGVRVPQLHGRVDVQDAPVVAPLHDLHAVDIPRQIDQQVAL